MRILVACEESQEVCKAFRAKGHEAYSCDIQPCSGGHPEWHINDDVSLLVDGYNGGYIFFTEDGKRHFIMRWDMLIAFPPCTYLTPAGASNIPKHPERIDEGWKAKEFFMKFYNADCPKICIENPPPMKRFCLPAYTQIVSPFMFGEPNGKKHALWLKGLSELHPTNIVEVPKAECVWFYKGKRKSMSKWYNTGDIKHRSQIRSKTFSSVAIAMAEQWG